MFNKTLPRLSVIAASMLLLHAPVGAKNKCKTFGSLVVQCALSAGSLTVNGNESVTGNLTVGGTITSTGNITTSGTITAANIVNPAGTTFGDLLAYANWYDTASGTVSAGNTFPFATASAANSSNITSGVGGFVFTVNLAGKYLIMYQISGTAAGLTTIQLEQAPISTGIFGVVPGGSVNMATGAFSEVSNVAIVQVSAGDQFQVANTGANVVQTSTTGGSVAGITFIRLHA